MSSAWRWGTVVSVPLSVFATLVSMRFVHLVLRAQVSRISDASPQHLIKTSLYKKRRKIIPSLKAWLPVFCLIHRLCSQHKASWDLYSLSRRLWFLGKTWFFWPHAVQLVYTWWSWRGLCYLRSLCTHHGRRENTEDPPSPFWIEISGTF